MITVFGAGGDRDRGKRAAMGAVAARMSDIAIVTDDNPRTEDPAHIRAEVMEGAIGAMEIGDRRAAIAEADRGWRARAISCWSPARDMRPDR